MKSMQEPVAICNWNDLLGRVNDLTDFVERAVRDGDAAHEVEKGLWDRVLKLGREALGAFFRICGDGDEGERVSLAEGRQVLRLEALHRREYLSVFGPFELHRVVYGTRESQKIEYVPLDCRLRLPASKFSYLLQDWDQSLVVEMPYTQVDTTVARILGFSQSVHSLERSQRKLAEEVAEFWERQPVPPADREGALMVCTADGKGIPIRGAARAAHIEDTKPSKGPKPGRKKMAVVGSVYTVDRFQRTPEEVLEALFRVPGAASDNAPPCRPKPLFKRRLTRSSVGWGWK
jgi:hypothetical protein